MDNVIVKILEQKEQQLKEEAKQRSFGLSQLRKLNNIIEQNGGEISNYLWELLLFNINELRLIDGKVCYTSFYKPSKRVLSLFARYNKVIVENFDYIVK